MSASDEGSAIVQEYLQLKQKELDNADDVEVVFGTLLYEMGEWRKSRTYIYFENLLRHRPGDPQVYFGIARTYYAFSELDQALSYLKQASDSIRQKEDKTEALIAKICCHMLRVYHELGDFKQVIALGEEALEIYQRLANSEHSSGIAHVLIYMGLVYFDQGRDETSLEHLQRAFALLKNIYSFEHPELSDCLTHLSFAYYHQGDYHKALDCIQRSSRMDHRLLPVDHPNISANENNIGKQYYKQGKYREAFKQFQRAVHIDIRTRTSFTDGHIVVVSNLGTTSYRLNDLDEAVAYYDKAPESHRRDLFNIIRPYLFGVYLEESR